MINDERMVYGHERLLSDRSNNPKQPGEQTWFHHDLLGSLQMTSDPHGQPLGLQQYDGWDTPRRDAISPFGFTGELHDGESGLVHLRARWYQPSHGAFASRDPFAGWATVPYSQHPYQYAYSNPVVYTDPSGECGIVNDNFFTAFWETAVSVMTYDCAQRAATAASQTDNWALKAPMLGVAAVASFGATAGWTGGTILATSGSAWAGATATVGRATMAARTAGQTAMARVIGLNATRAGGLGTVLASSVSLLDEAMITFAALCGDPFSANEIHVAQQMAMGDGGSGFGDFAAAMGLFGGRFRTFYHATTRLYRDSILTDGIDLNRGRLSLDFNPAGQRGFYVTNDFAQARRRVAYYGDAGALVEFLINRDDLYALNGRVFITPDSDWAQMVTEGRRNTLDHQFDFVEGPMLANPIQVVAGEELPRGFDHQLAIFTDQAVQIFNQGRR